MATATSGTSETREKSDHGASIVVVDLGEPQSHAAVSHLCKGRGPLFTHVEKIVKELVTEGTVKASAQPIVIVVREYPTPPWLMGDDDD
jgi:Family of unknown function (DUF6200)